MVLAWLVRVQIWLRSERGQALSEYGVVVALIALACIAAVTAFQNELKAMFERLAEQVKSIGVKDGTP